jgi:hypothetical protein
MHEELENFERNQVWTLVEPPRDVNVIGTKCVFKNKQGEDGEVVWNEARLIAQGFIQVKSLDSGETFAPVVHLEAIRILLAFVMCTRLGSTCSKLLWPNLLVGSANLINCRCVTW